MTAEPEPTSKIAAAWDRAFEERADLEKRASYYALASPLYQRLYLNRRFSRDRSEPWPGWVKRTFAADRPFERALVLGCGLGDGLVDLYLRGIAKSWHGVDLSPAAVEKGREIARRHGLSEVVTFEVGDFHDCPLSPHAYDAVFMIMSLHHALDLDRVFEQVRRALKPAGLFIVNEYVGPNRWQFTRTQLLLANGLLRLLPRRLRLRLDGSVKASVKRPTIEEMLAMDPSESAHSEEIVERFERSFRIEHRVDYGGAVSQLVLDEIVGSFREDRWRDRMWLRLVVAVDWLAWRTGLVPVANALLAGTPR